MSANISTEECLSQLVLNHLTEAPHIGETNVAYKLAVAYDIFREDAPKMTECFILEAAGVVSSDTGIVIKMADDTEYQLTIKRTK